MSGASVSVRTRSIWLLSCSLCWCEEWSTCRTTSTPAARPRSGASTSVSAGSPARVPESLAAASPLSMTRSLGVPLLAIDGLREVAADLARRSRKAAAEEREERLEVGCAVSRPRGRTQGEEPARVLERPAERLCLMIGDDQRDVVVRLAASQPRAFRRLGRLQDDQVAEDDARAHALGVA